MTFVAHLNVPRNARVQTITVTASDTTDPDVIAYRLKRQGFKVASVRAVIGD